MQLFPAIDLRGGKVVRLTQGDYDRMTVYGEDPCAQARAFLEAGAKKHEALLLTEQQVQRDSLAHVLRYLHHTRLR